MGYRLEIKNKEETLCYYGTKYYGYKFGFIEEARKMKIKSVLYLDEIGKTKDIVGIWVCGIENEMVLSADEFNVFIKLYRDEYKRFKHSDIFSIKEITDLMNDKTDKIISWS